MRLEALRSEAMTGAPEGLAGAVIASLQADHRVRVEGEGAALAEHQPRMSQEEAALQGQLLDAARDAGLAGLDAAALDRLGSPAPLRDRMVRFLLADGSLQRVGGTLLVHRDHLQELEALVRRRWTPGSLLDVGAVKDLTGLSRKYVIPLLEYLDAKHVTRRSGNERVVLAAPPRAT